MIKKMIAAVQSFNSPMPEDLYYSAKLINSLESSDDVCLSAYQWVKDNDTQLLKSEWVQINPIDLSEIDSERYHYICIEFGDGSHIPLPLVANYTPEDYYYGFCDNDRSDGYPLQSIIISMMLEEFDPVKTLIKEVDKHYNKKVNILKDRMVAEGIASIVFNAHHDHYTQSYYNRDSDYGKSRNYAPVKLRAELIDSKIELYKKGIKDSDSFYSICPLHYINLVSLDDILGATASA